jgi:hypothetical protein
MTELADIQRLQAELRTEKILDVAVAVASFVFATWAIGVILGAWGR